MTTLKHYIGKTEVSTIVEVLTEMDVANKLNLKSDNYTGTAVYQYMNCYFKREDALYVSGVVGYHNKAELRERAQAYLNRKFITPEQKRAIADVIRLVKTQPERAQQALAILAK